MCTALTTLPTPNYHNASIPSHRQSCFQLTLVSFRDVSVYLASFWAKVEVRMPIWIQAIQSKTCPSPSCPRLSFLTYTTYKRYVLVCLVELPQERWKETFARWNEWKVPLELIYYWICGKSRLVAIFVAFNSGMLGALHLGCFLFHH